MAKKKKKETKEKTKRVRKPMKRWELYDLKDGIKRKNKSCPKCGQGTFMARHNNRDTCGKCGYTEFRK